jgi:hypothetical protein
LPACTRFTWANAKATRRLSNITRGIVKSQESTSQQEAQLFGFEAFTLGAGATNVTFTFARVVFATHPDRARSDDIDIHSIDDRDPFSCRWHAPCPPFVEVDARVDSIPEPATVVLPGAGLGLLATRTRLR